MTALPPPVFSLVTLLLHRLQTLLGPNLLGLYRRGSLACGGFEPSRSDIDLLAVTARTIDDGTFSVLHSLHQEIARSDHPFANRLEIAYIDQDTLRRWQPGRRHPTLGQGEELTWQEHGANWLFERWVVRQHGAAIFGPDPATLIEPITPAEIKAAAVDRLQDWADWARDESDPDWQLPRDHKAYAVETICRGLYTVEVGALPGKVEAVEWAMEALPEPWRNLVRRSRTWLLDRSADPSLIPEVRAFILWAAVEAKRPQIL
jgi:hypothetical protein